MGAEKRGPAAGSRARLSLSGLSCLPLPKRFPPARPIRGECAAPTHPRRLAFRPEPGPRALGSLDDSSPKTSAPSSFLAGELGRSFGAGGTTS